LYLYKNTVMTREQQILQHNVDELNTLIANYYFYNINQKKIDKLIIKRDLYQTALNSL